MTLRDYGAVIWRRKWIVLVPAIITPVVALVLTFAQDPRYRASTEVLVREPASATSVGAPERPMQSRVLQNELQRAQGSTMQDSVRDLIGAEPEISVKLASNDDSDVFRFTAVSVDADAAADAANAYAAVYIDARRNSLIEELAARADVVEDRIAGIEAELAEADGDTDQTQILELQLSQYEFEFESLNTSVSLAEQSGATVIDAARPPSAPFEPTPMRTAVLALVVGLLIGLGAAFLVDYLDNSVRGEDDLVAATGVPVLATVPALPGWRPDGPPHVVTREQPSSLPAEAYRGLRTAVQFLGVDRRMKIVQITSPKPGDGKTTTASNLAVVCARAGQRVVLVDCDLRRPRVHEFFGLDNRTGFTSAMVGATLAEIAQAIEGESNLKVIPSGPVPPDPSELLSGPTARNFLAHLADECDLVVVDSPPVLAVADPLVISASSDGVIVVASATGTDRRQASRTIAQLTRIDAQVLGTVLNGARGDGEASYGYHYSYEAQAPARATGELAKVNAGI